MKKILIASILLFVCFASCTEDFSPDAKYRERNVLNCIIRPDTTLQIVSLFRTYRTEGNPYEFSEYPFIENADVKMWFNNQVYQFNDTTLERKDASRYKDSIKTYYNSSIKPVGGKYVEVEALLPNGLLLKAETLIPSTDKISFAGSASIIPASLRDNIRFIWADDQNVMYAPRFVIVIINKQTQREFKVKIPLKYINRNSVEEAVYPSITSEKAVMFTPEAVTRAFQSIGGNDPVKSNYSVIGAYLELMLLDRFLSIYYSSIENFLDEFTIKVDLPDYSNIDGGFGIFGSYNLVKYRIAIDENFVKSFGYTVGF